MSRRKKKSRGLYDEFISEYNRLKLTKLNYWRDKLWQEIVYFI